MDERRRLELDYKDRVILSFLLRLLERTDPEFSDEYAQMKQAIDSGFALHYDWIAEHVDPNELSAEDCREVLDILNMFRDLTFSYQRLGDKTGVDVESIRFTGFSQDDDDEAKRLSYVNYFILTLGRYDELREQLNSSSFDVHVRSLARYRAMLAVYEEIRKRRPFTPHRYLDKEEILRVAAAANQGE